MINLKDKKNILWDFDGVIMDSMPVRNRGFELVLKDYPKEQVQELMDFHLKNGGLSRYVKFRHFFEEIRKESITEHEIKSWSESFSKVMKSNLINSDLLIQDSLEFIKRVSNDYEMHIVSGSDGEELRFLCKENGISAYFDTINGSPTPKIELVKNIIEGKEYDLDSYILIGDSKNDYEAAQVNGISFAGYNNDKLKELSKNYIERFSDLD